MPQGFRKPTAAATLRPIRAGNFLRVAKSPWPPAPLLPPTVTSGLAAGLKSNLK